MALDDFAFARWRGVQMPVFRLDRQMRMSIGMAYTFNGVIYGGNLKDESLDEIPLAPIKFSTIPYSSNCFRKNLLVVQIWLSDKSFQLPSNSVFIIKMFFYNSNKLNTTGFPRNPPNPRAYAQLNRRCAFQRISTHVHTSRFRKTSKANTTSYRSTSTHTRPCRI